MWLGPTSGTGVANGDGDVNISASGCIGEPDIIYAPDNRAGGMI